MAYNPEKTEKNSITSSEQRLREQLFAHKEPDYDPKEGWHKLSTQLLDANMAPQSLSAGRTNTRRLPVWQLAAASIVLMTIGFWAGRWTVKPGQPIAATASLALNPTTVKPTEITSIPEKNVRPGVTTAKTVSKNNPHLSLAQSAPIPLSRPLNPSHNPQTHQGSERTKPSATAISQNDGVMPNTQTRSVPNRIHSDLAKANASLINNQNKESMAHSDLAATDKSVMQLDTHQLSQPRPQSKPLPVISMESIDMMANFTANSMSADNTNIPPGKNMYKTLSRHNGSSAGLPLRIKL